MKKNKKQLQEYDERLSPEAQALNDYLYQYRDCLRKKKTLERRKEEIKKEFECPLHGVHYDGMPHASGVSVGAAAISFRLDEIETKISEQMEKTAKVLTDTMSIIDFLEDDGHLLSKEVIEDKYIDGMRWDEICKETNTSKSMAVRHWKAGLYRLLEFKKVGKILKEYKKHEGY